MKKFIIPLVICCAPLASLACPFCGCGNNYFQVGILPTYNKGFVGLRYSYSQYDAIGRGVFDGQFSHDYYQSAELWGGYQSGRIQVMAFIPYMVTHELSDDGVKDFNGIGDLTFLVNYKLISTTSRDQSGNPVSGQNLWIGAGIKFPSGESKVDIQDPGFSVGDFASTPGTGSTDYFVTAMHTFLKGRNGIVTNVAYRINALNHQQFRYGNRFYLNTAFFRSFTFGPMVIRPSAGLNMDLNGTNKYEHRAVDNSNGYVLSGLAGVNTQFKNIGIAANGYLPFLQDLYNGQTNSKGRVSIALTYSF